jgi:hypothetical protein
MSVALGPGSTQAGLPATSSSSCWACCGSWAEILGALGAHPRHCAPAPAHRPRRGTAAILDLIGIAALLVGLRTQSAVPLAYAVRARVAVARDPRPGVCAAHHQPPVGVAWRPRAAAQAVVLTALVLQLVMLPRSPRRS